MGAHTSRSLQLESASSANCAGALGKSRTDRAPSPSPRYLGVTPQDIIDYQLPTHPLQDVDVKRAKDALKNDPFFKSSKPWQKAIAQLLQMGVRAEQQSLAMWGLNYVIEEYLPAKLRNVGAFLP